MPQDDVDSGGREGRIDELADWSSELVARLGDGLADEEVAARWLPVLRSGSAAVGSAVTLGRQLWEARDEVDVAEVVEDLNRESIDLLSSFPNVADLYRDLDRFDAWLHSRREVPGLADSFGLYLQWLERLVDGVVRRMVLQATSGESTDLSPGRVAQFLDEFDVLLEEIFERWLLDATLHPEPERNGRGREGDGEGASRDQ